MSEAKNILASMGIDLDTKRFELKLRAIAKHTEALADELDAIDNAWQCECSSYDYTIESLVNSNTNEVISRSKVCSECYKNYELLVDDELPTRLEGSD